MAEIACDAVAAPVAEEAPAPAVAAPACAFVRGELVWGHCKGFPWWPCQVRSIKGVTKPLPGDIPKMRLRFFETEDNAELVPERVVKYEVGKAADYGVVKKKMFKSGGLQKKFEAAVRQSVEWHERGGPPPREPDAPAEVWSDDEHVDLEEVEAAKKEATETAHLWRTDGHEFIGKHVRTRAAPPPPLPSPAAAAIARLPCHPHTPDSILTCAFATGRWRATSLKIPWRSARARAPRKLCLQSSINGAPCQSTLTRTLALTLTLTPTLSLSSHP